MEQSASMLSPESRLILLSAGGPHNDSKIQYLLDKGLDWNRVKAIAQRADNCKRDGDLLFRYGGEEFVILLRDTDLEGAQLLAERIRNCIASAPCSCAGIDLDITVSIGVSSLRKHDSPVSLFARADQALYSAKRSGRNQVCIAARAA